MGIILGSKYASNHNQLFVCIFLPTLLRKYKQFHLEYQRGHIRKQFTEAANTTWANVIPSAYKAASIILLFSKII